MMSILPYGDSAFLVNFDQVIDRATHQKVLALQASLQDAPGMRYMIPAFCSLTVVYDHMSIAQRSLKHIIEEKLELLNNLQDLPDAHKNTTGLRCHTIPVCYDPEFALDLEEVRVQTRKTYEEIIATHLEKEFYVYMLGFMPGFAYMGDMPEEYSCRRKETPRTKVPAGSVGLALRQTAIYPFESPGGWQIIGRTPLKMFDASRADESVLKAGDTVRFKRISSTEFKEYV